MPAPPFVVRLTLEPLPTWLDLTRWLGSVPFTTELLACGRVRAVLELSRDDAADWLARVRGLGLDGRTLIASAEPPLARALVREGRLRDARARRDTTPGFVRPTARATGEGRYSLTPESLALALGTLADGVRVVDACCGSGGNAIGFARAGCAVTAIELDAARLDEARHNAAVYGVAPRIAFVHGDARTLVTAHAGDVLFVDPPWGADYDKRATGRADFPLLDALLAQKLSASYGALWAKLPASFELASLGVEQVEARAFFGEAEGDRHRIKFVLVMVELAARA